MLAIIRILEGDLATISQESRRAVPAVKEAAEQALLELRRAQHGGPPRDDLGWRTLVSQCLQPVYLACNHIDAPRALLTVAMAALQRAVVADALLSGEYLNVVRVLEIQAGSADEGMRLRVLQALPLVLAQRSCGLEKATCAVALGLCFGFLADRSAALRAAAAAALQQSASLMYERAASGGGDAAALASCEAFFCDMVCCAGGVPSQWMRRTTPVPRVLAADMVSWALVNYAHPPAAAAAPAARSDSGTSDARALLREVLLRHTGGLLAPLLLRQLPTQASFPLLLRCFRMARDATVALALAPPLEPPAPAPAASAVDVPPVTPRPGLRALLSLLIRLLHAAGGGGGEDLGADATRTLDRFGAAGARILQGARRALLVSPAGGVRDHSSAASAADSPAVEGGGREAAVPTHSTTAAGTKGDRTAAYDAEAAADEADAALLRAVASIPLGPQPRWRVLLLLECVACALAVPGLVAAIHALFDAQQPQQHFAQVSAHASHHLQHPRLLGHLLDALAGLSDRLLVLPGGSPGASASSAIAEGVGHEHIDTARYSSSSGGGSYSPVMLARRPSARSRVVSRGSSGGPDAVASAMDDYALATAAPAAAGGDEFAVSPRELEAAAEVHPRRPLAGLACSDADSHLAASSVGGLQAAVAFAASHGGGTGGGSAGSGTIGGAASGLAAAVVGATLSFVQGSASALAGGAYAAASGFGRSGAGGSASGGAAASSSASAAAAAIYAAGADSAAFAVSSGTGKGPVEGGDAAHPGAAPPSSVAHAADTVAVPAAALAHAGTLALLILDCVGATTEAVADAAAEAEAEMDENRVDALTAARSLALTVVRPCARVLSVAAESLGAVGGAVCAPSVSVLRSLLALAYACGSMGLGPQQDSLLAALARAAAVEPAPFAVGDSSDMDPTSGSNTDGASGLSPKRIAALTTLVNVARCLGGHMRPTSWAIVLGALDDAAAEATEAANAGAGGGGASGGPGSSSTADASRAAAWPPSAAASAPTFCGVPEAAWLEDPIAAAASVAATGTGVLRSLRRGGYAAATPRPPTRVRSLAGLSPPPPSSPPRSPTREPGAASGDASSFLSPGTTAALHAEDDAGVLWQAVDLLFRDWSCALSESGLRAMVRGLVRDAEAALAAEVDEAERLVASAHAATLAARPHRVAASVGAPRPGAAGPGRSVDAMLSKEQMAADEAVEIMAAHQRETAAAAAAAAAASAALQRQHLDGAASLLASDVCAATDAAVAPWVLSDVASAAASTSDTRVAPAPYSLVRLTHTLAYNAWRLEAVWAEAAPFLRGLSSSRSAVARALGATAAADVAVSALLGLSHAPPESWHAEAAPTLSSHGAVQPVPQEELLAPLVAFARSAHAASRAAAAAAFRRVLEEAGSRLSHGPSGEPRVPPRRYPHRESVPGGPSTPLRPIAARLPETSATPLDSNAATAETVANDSSPAPDLGGWAVVLGSLLGAAAGAAGVEPSLPATDEAAGSMSRAAASLDDGEAEEEAAEEGEGPVVTLPHLGAALLPRCVTDSVRAAAGRPAAPTSAAHTAVVRRAFDEVQLVCDDFYDALPAAGLSLLSSSLALFARQRCDANVALTAVTQLWKVAEHTALLRARLQQTPASASTAALRRVWRQLYADLLGLCDGSEAVELTLPSPATGAPSVVALPAPAAAPEVRNAAVQALFASLIAHGPAMDGREWHRALVRQALPLVLRLTTVAQVNLAQGSGASALLLGAALGRRRQGAAVAAGDGGADTTAPASASLQRVTLHHSRDTLGKQWNETRIAVYRGLTRVLTSCFDALLLRRWLPDAWSQVLAMLERSVIVAGAGPAAGPGLPADRLESADVALAAVACLQELLLLVAAPAGPARPACEGDERISFDMRVVDGALVRVVDSSQSQQQQSQIPSTTVAASVPRGSTATDSSALLLRTRSELWADAWAVLQAVGGSEALHADDAEAVWPAVAECICAVATAVTPPTFAAPASPASVFEAPDRFGSLLSLVGSMAARRRIWRWGQCNGKPPLPPAPESEVATAAAAAGIQDTTTSSARVGGVLAEELTAPKTDVSCGSERAVVRGVEGLLEALQVVTASRAVSWTQGLPRDSATAALRAAWTATLRLAVQLAVAGDETVAGGVITAAAGVDDELDSDGGAATSSSIFLRRPSGDATNATPASVIVSTSTSPGPSLVLPPSALAANTLRVLQAFLDSCSAAPGGGAGSEDREGPASRRRHTRHRHRTVDASGATATAAEEPGGAAAVVAARAFVSDAVSALSLEVIPALAAAQLRVRAAAATAEAALRPHLAKSALHSARGSGEHSGRTNAATASSSATRPISLGDVAALAGLAHVPELAAAALLSGGQSSEVAGHASRPAAAARPAPRLTSIAATASAERSGPSLSGGLLWASTIVSAVAGSGGASNGSDGGGVLHPASTVPAAQPPPAAAPLSSAAQAPAPVFPIKIWGFGLGGSYGAGGGGSFVAADLPKASRQLGRAQAHEAALLAALTAAVGLASSLGDAPPLAGDGPGSSSSAEWADASTASVTLALLDALEGVVGWRPTAVTGTACSSSPPLSRLERLLGACTDADDALASRATRAAAMAAAGDDVGDELSEGVPSSACPPALDEALDAHACAACDDALWAAADAASTAAVPGVSPGPQCPPLQRCIVAGRYKSAQAGRSKSRPDASLADSGVGLGRGSLQRLLGGREFRAASAALGWRHSLLAGGADRSDDGSGAPAAAADCVRAEAVLLAASLRGFMRCLASWDGLLVKQQRLQQQQGERTLPVAGAAVTAASPASQPRAAVQPHPAGAGATSRHRVAAAAVPLPAVPAASAAPPTPSRTAAPGAATPARTPAAAATAAGDACVGLALRLLPLLLAGAAALAVNPLQAPEREVGASAAGFSTSTLEQCRRLRAFGRLCFDSLRALAGVTDRVGGDADGGGAVATDAEADVAAAAAASSPSALVAAHARDLLLSRASSALAAHARVEGSLRLQLGSGDWRHVSATSAIDAIVVAAALHSLLAESGLRRGDVPALRGPYDVAVALTVSAEPALRAAAARLLGLLAGAVFDDAVTAQ